jgi:beta-glucanase (GH16 family)
MTGTNAGMGRLDSNPSTMTPSLYQTARNRIRWYFDDQLYATVTPADLRRQSWVFDHDFYLLLNVAVGGTHSESPEESAAFPQTMLIDHVRVYSIVAASADPLVPSAVDSLLSADRGPAQSDARVGRLGPADPAQSGQAG